MLNYTDKRRGLPTAVLPYLLVSVAPLCWAGNVVLARGVVDIIPPVAFAFWRWAVAFAVLVPFSWRYVKEDWKLAVKSWKIMVVLSLLGISAFNTLLYTAVHTTTAINAAMIQSTMPAMIILITLMLYRERITRGQAFGVAVCISGAFVVILRGRLGALFAMTFARGDLMMVCAVAIYALYSALLPKRPAIHPLSFLSLSFGLGTLGLLPLYAIEIAGGQTLAWSGAVILSILYVSLFPSVLAYFCWNRGVQFIGANRTGLFINLIPVFATILAVLLLGESLAMFHITGMLLIFAGLFLFNR